MINYGELYFNHYCKFLGEPIDREVYKNNESMPKIQILKYENVFEECLIYSTLGFSKYEEIVNNNVEISMVVDSAFRSTGYILGNVLFYCIGNGMSMERGVSISGIESIDKEFVDKYNKSALYFIEPYNFPEDFNIVSAHGQNKDGKILLAFYISQKEFEYFQKYGAERFEDLLETNDVDPFNVGRKSMI